MLSDPQPGKRYLWRSPKSGDVIIIMTDDEAYREFESSGALIEAAVKTRRGPQGMREVIIESGRFAGQNAFVPLSELYELP